MADEKEATTTAADKPAAEKKAPVKKAPAKAAAEGRLPRRRLRPRRLLRRPAPTRPPHPPRRAPGQGRQARREEPAKAEGTENREHVLKVHHLRPAAGSNKAKTRVGRGEGSKGKTAGRGTKGTKARYQVRVGFEGGQMPLHMRAPKLRGFKNPFRVEYQVVNLEKLAELYPDGWRRHHQRPRRQGCGPQEREGQGSRHRRHCG